MNDRRQHNEFPPLPPHMRSRAPMLPSHTTQSRIRPHRRTAHSSPRRAGITSRSIRDDILPSPYNIIDMDPDGTTTTVIGELPEHMRASIPIYRSPTQAASRAIWGDSTTSLTTVTPETQLLDHIVVSTPVYHSQAEEDVRLLWRNATITSPEEVPDHMRGLISFYYSQTEAADRSFGPDETTATPARRLVVTNGFAPDTSDAPDETPRRTSSISTTLSPSPSPSPPSTGSGPVLQGESQPNSQRPPDPIVPSPGRFYIDTGVDIQLDFRLEYSVDETPPGYRVRNVDVELSSYTRIEAGVGRRRRLVAMIREFFRSSS